MHTVEVDGAGAIFNGDLSGRVEFVVERGGQSTQRFMVPAELIREIYEHCYPGASGLRGARESGHNVSIMASGRVEVLWREEDE